MELSENLKLRLENIAGDNQQDRTVRAANPAIGDDAEPNDEAELQMRKALGLMGEGQRTDPNRNVRSSRTAQATGLMVGCTVAGLSRMAIFRLPCSAGIRVTKCQPIAGLPPPPRRQLAGYNALKQR